MRRFIIISSADNFRGEYNEFIKKKRMAMKKVSFWDVLLNSISHVVNWLVGERKNQKLPTYNQNTKYFLPQLVKIHNFDFTFCSPVDMSSLYFHV